MIKDIDKITYTKRPLNRVDLLKDDSIIHPYVNEFIDFDDDEYLSYLNERYGGALSILCGYVSPKKVKKLNKREFKRHNKKKYSKRNKNIPPYVNDSYLFDDEDMYDDSSIVNDKDIYFYRDINDPDTCDRFDNLHEFDLFLTSEGIEISDDEVNSLMSREVSHCTINPYERINKNRLRLLSSSRYGDLRWTCAELEYETIE